MEILRSILVHLQKKKKKKSKLTRGMVEKAENIPQDKMWIITAAAQLVIISNA